MYLYLNMPMGKNAENKEENKGIEEILGRRIGKKKEEVGDRR